ncbi:MAG: hypothetical protein FWD36_10395 [Treponema sp.]|nr:hypothetical protein [Treponema sp.]
MNKEERTKNKVKKIRRFLISHRSLFSVLCSLFFVLCSCASTGMNNDSIAIPADIAGLVHAGETRTSEEYALLDRMGASWVLATFYWGRIQRAEDQWNFESYDLYVDTAKAAGKKVLGVLGYDVAWIHDDGKTKKYIPPDKLHYFYEYVRQTAEHFQGRVDAWCIWNEPNFHFWQGSRDEFFVLARGAADALREVDPDVILLGGAFNRGVFGLPKAYIRGLFESGAMEKADGLAFHPYELNPARTAKLYHKFRAIAADYDFADRIWVTEVGYPTGGLYPTKTTEKKFPAFVAKTFVNLAVSGTHTIMWYELFDSQERKRSNSEDFFGLVRSKTDYTSKGAEAFSLCAVHLAGTVYRPDLPQREKLPNSLHTFYFEQPEGEGGTLVLWKKGGGSAKLRLQIPGDSNAVMHNPVSGDAAAISAETIITVRSMPVFVTWQGNHQPVLVKRR